MDETINRRQMRSSSRRQAFFKFGLFRKTVPSILPDMLLLLFCLDITSVCAHTHAFTQNLKINDVAEGDSISAKGVVNHWLNMKDGQWVQPKIFYAPLLHASPPICVCSGRICVAHKRPNASWTKMVYRQEINTAPLQSDHCFSSLKHSMM